MKRFLARAFLLAAASAAPLPALSDPAAPSGWRASLSGDSNIYRPSANPDVELRVYPAETVAAGPDAWFAGQLERRVAGIPDLDWGDTARVRENTFTPIGQAGPARQGLVVVVTGCEPAPRKRRYAELILPADEAMLATCAEQAAGVLAQVCRPLDVRSGPASKPAPPPAAVHDPAPGRATPAASALAESDIEGVLCSFRQLCTITGLQFTEHTRLLLKHGTARRDVPGAAPADFDLQADRAANAQDWGQLKRSGGKIQLDFADGFETPEGQMLRVAGKKVERLEGRYQKASSYSMGRGRRCVLGLLGAAPRA